MQTENKNTTAMIIASQNQDYVDEGLAEYQDQIHKLQSKSCIGYKQESRREGWTDAAIMLCKLNKSL